MIQIAVSEFLKMELKIRLRGLGGVGC